MQPRLLCADHGLDTLLFAGAGYDVANEAVEVALSGGILTAAQVAGVPDRDAAGVRQGL